MKEIVIATRNKHKFDEIKFILSDIDCRFLFAGDFPELPEVVENGNSLLENATIKAKTTATLLNKPCIADDTGFFVRSLDYEPGIYAAVYAGEKCSYEENVTKLLSKLKDIKDRFAYFQTITVLYDPDKGFVAQSEGTVCGNVLEDYRGTNGFGYDPVFVPEFSDKTYSEMTDEEKNTSSHRYKSIYGLKEHIKKYLFFKEEL